MAITLRYFTEFGKPAFQHNLFRAQESSHMLSRLLMSFLFSWVSSCSSPLIMPSSIKKALLPLSTGPAGISHFLSCSIFYKIVAVFLLPSYLALYSLL